MALGSRHRVLVVFAYALMAIGVVLMVLGFFEIGGLFNVVVGFVAVCLGLLLSFSDDEDGDAREEEEFARLLKDR